MPAKSVSQQQAFGIAAGIKEGKIKPKPGTPSAQIAKSASLPDIKEFASTPTGGLPKKVKKKAVPKPKMTKPTGMAPMTPMATPPAPPAVGKPMAAPAAPPVPAAPIKPARAVPPAPPVAPPMPKAARPPIFGLGLRKK